MSGDLFNKSTKKSCLWCIYAKKSEYTEEIFCKKRGVTTANDYCRKYKYDPLKRKPDVQRIAGNFSNDDFLL